MIKDLIAWLTTSKWDLILIAIALAFSSGMALGWHEKALRVATEDLVAQTKAIAVHADQENKSEKAGKDIEHAKTQAKKDIAAVPKGAGHTSVFDDASVREQRDIIAAGESALKRKY